MKCREMRQWKRLARARRAGRLFPLHKFRRCPAGHLAEGVGEGGNAGIAEIGGELLDRHIGLDRQLLDGGRDPPNWNERSNLLSLAAGIWRATDRALERSCTGEQPAAQSGIGSDAGQAHSAGGGAGKLLSPARPRTCIEQSGPTTLSRTAPTMDADTGCSTCSTSSPINA